MAGITDRCRLTAEGKRQVRLRKALARSDRDIIREPSVMDPAARATRYQWRGVPGRESSMGGRGAQ
jgi:hypothetical protein